MAYVSLYRKYRPQTFADVTGQEHVTRTLQNAIAGGRIAHGYLFTGTRGTAKTTVARLLAKALNCENGPGREPCNACDACTSITNGSCIDVIEMDAASHRGVADIEEVRKAVGYGPMQFRYKVFIIDEAHQLSSDAKDAFLKTLEEPPPGVVFVLATTEPQAIPITIRSRCQQFDFKRGSLADIAGRLKYVLTQEGVDFTDEAVNLVARGAEGSYRDSLSLLEQVLAYAPKSLTAADVDLVLGTLDTVLLARVTDVVSRHDAASAFALAGELLDAGKEARTLLRALSTHFRDLLLVTVGGPAVANELTPDEAQRLQIEARRFTPPQMLRAIDILNEAQGETRWNNQHRLLVELTFLKLMSLGDDAAAPATFATAAQPIVFPQPVAVAAPVVAAATPTPPPPQPPPAEADANESLPPAFFAADDDDEADDDEDDYEPPLLDAAEVQSAAAEPEPEPAAEIDTSPGLFEDEPDLSNTDRVPASPPTSRPQDDMDRELDAMIGFGNGRPMAAPPPPARTPRATPPVPQSATPATPDLSGPGGLTLDAVLRIWPRFLRDAAHISMRASVLLGGASPTEVAGGGRIVVVTFNNRANHAMMDMPKQQEFVRNLLARCLGRESVQVRFVLDVNAPAAAPPPTPSREKQRRDPMEALDSLPPMQDDSAHGFSAAATYYEYNPPPPSSPAPAPVAVAPPTSAPSSPPPAVAAPKKAAPPTVPSATLMEEPLVQEALTIFGGEIVDDPS